MHLCVCVCSEGGGGDELHCILLTTRIDQHNLHGVVYHRFHKDVMFDLRDPVGHQSAPPVCGVIH